MPTIYDEPLAHAPARTETSNTMASSPTIAQVSPRQPHQDCTLRYTACRTLPEEALMAIVPTPVEEIRFLDDDEARQQFDRQAQRLMGISGEEFLRRYEAGEFKALRDDRQQRAVMKLTMLADLVR